MKLIDYQHRYSTAEVSRDDAGVLTVRMHSDGGPLIWGAAPHAELGELFGAIAADRDNRVVILTGSGDAFIKLPPGDGPGALARGEYPAEIWDRIIREGNRLLHNLLDIEVPMIAAVNGPVTVHSELAVLCDIVLAADSTYFQDAPHFPGGLVPGDGVQVIWPLLLGPNRGRYFLLTGQKIAAEEARALGVVGEVLPTQELMPRAQALAVDLAGRNPILLRNTRHVLTRPLKRALADDLHGGLALEALASLSGATWFKK
ncbi:enoyl-CoA hydratase/isomerase family protein [Nevskia ramosa]|uniref:enoyl-CoA hydratase/isomerase family protein n=1 Tax=Nevskia ramosa TaxID=64002 RepID=UPI0003B47D07|nr:enoyl-CoA hydratase/isomerase family protein [Nevskia ramosa]